MERDPVVVNRLKQVLKNYFTDKSRDKTLTLMKKGKLCSKNLFRAMTEKHPRVFKQKFMADVNKVDLCLAIDLSGSMSDIACYKSGKHSTRLDEAKNLAYQLYLAMNDIEDMNFMMFGFHCLPSVYHEVFKKFGGKLCKGFDSVQPHGDNNDYEAIRWAGEQLANQPNKKKILFVISDGQPAHGQVDINALHRETKLIVEKLLNDGVEVISFYIGPRPSDGKQIYGNRSIAVNPSDLCGSVVEKLIDIVKKM